MSTGSTVAPAVRAQLDAHVAGIIKPLCAVVGILYLGYAASEPFLAPADRLEGLRSTWAVSGAILLGAAFIFHKRRPAPQYAHLFLTVIALVVLFNSLRLVYTAGPFFSNVLVLVMLGFATLALSIRWVIGLVLAAFTGWLGVAYASTNDVLWTASGSILVSAGCIAILTQFLRLRAMVRVVQTHERDVVDREQRHQREQARLRADLINQAAHEVSTPLTPIMIELYALRNNENPTASQSHRIDVIERNINRLAAGIENIQKLSVPPPPGGAREPPALERPRDQG